MVRESSAIFILRVSIKHPSYLQHLVSLRITMKENVVFFQLPSIETVCSYALPEGKYKAEESVHREGVKSIRKGVKTISKDEGKNEGIKSIVFIDNPQLYRWL